LKLLEEGRDTIEKLHLISGLPLKDTRVFFESLITLMMLDYMEGHNTYLPHIGRFYYKYEGDNVTNRGKEAKVSLEYEADKNLLNIFGTAIDGEETMIEKTLKEQIKAQLKKYEEV
jgi:hypothetical protein